MFLHNNHVKHCFTEEIIYRFFKISFSIQNGIIIFDLDDFKYKYDFIFYNIIFLNDLNFLKEPNINFSWKYKQIK